MVSMSTQLNFMSDTVVTMCLTGYQGRSSALADAHMYKKRTRVCVCVCLCVCLSVSSLFLMHGHSFERICTKCNMWHPYRPTLQMVRGGRALSRRIPPPPPAENVAPPPRQPKLTSAAVYCAANHLHLFNQSFLSRENLQTVNHMLTEDRFCHITLILRSLY